MRSNKEFLEEIHIRGERYKAKKSRQRKAVLLSVIPVAICCVILLGNAVTPIKKGAGKSEGKSDETMLYTGTYEVLEDAEDSATDTQDVYDDTASAQTHYPNEEYDGDYSLVSSSAAPLKDEAVSSGFATSNAIASHSGSTLKSDSTIHSGYVFIYGCVATDVENTDSVEKMKEFIKDATQNPIYIDWANKPEPLFTIEIDGKDYSLVGKYLCEGIDAEGPAYLLGRNQAEALYEILNSDKLLNKELIESLEEVINNIEEPKETDNTPKDD